MLDDIVSRSTEASGHVEPILVQKTCAQHEYRTGSKIFGIQHQLFVHTIHLHCRSSFTQSCLCLSAYSVYVSKCRVCEIIYRCAYSCLKYLQHAANTLDTYILQGHVAHAWSCPTQRYCIWPALLQRCTQRKITYRHRTDSTYFDTGSTHLEFLSAESWKKF